jgi:hypothetical protein
MSQPSSRVDFVVHHIVSASKVEEFHQAQTKLAKACASFDGFLLSDTKEIEDSSEGKVAFATLLAFDNVPHLAAWLDSSERQALLQEMTEALEEYDYSFQNLYTGFEGWFEDSISETPRKVPKRWRQATLVLFGLYPVLLFLRVTVNPFLPKWPASISLFVGSVLSVTLLSGFLLPLLNQWFRTWLLEPRFTLSSWKPLILMGIITVAIIFGSLELWPDL